jgi:hypothetical protein
MMRTTRGPAPRPWPILLAALLLLPALGGCSTARMPVPAGLEAAPRLDVQGRQGMRIRQQLRFGPYETHELQRSWTLGRDLSVRPVSASGRRQRFEFTLREEGRPIWRADCQATLVRAGATVGGVEIDPLDRSTLECRLDGAGDTGEHWNLSMSEQYERPLAGAARQGAATVEVRGTNRLDGALSAAQTTGYEITEGGRALAAVEVVNDGAVWLRPDLGAERRGMLAALAAALLLVEELRETLGER